MRLALAFTLALAGGSAAAQDLSFTPAPAQSDFESASKDIIAITSYKALGPGEAGGLTGFSIGAYGSYTQVQSGGAWRRLTGSDVDGVGAAGINVRKGLPFGFDVGLMVAAVPGTDAKIYGGEVRWAFVPGGIATPALAVRGTYTKLSGEDDVEADAQTIDLSISKGFAFFTPYAGAGYVHGNVNPDNRFVTLDKAKVDKARFFAGGRLTFGFFELTPEFEKLGGNEVYNLRASIGF